MTMMMMWMMMGMPMKTPTTAMELKKSIVRYMKVRSVNTYISSIYTV